MRAADRIPTVHARVSSDTTPMQRMVLKAAVASRGIGPSHECARYWRVTTELQRRGLLRREGPSLVITDAGLSCINHS
jgi:hypothetical protein